MAREKFDVGTPVLIKGTVLRTRGRMIEVQTRDGELLHCNPDPSSITVNETQVKANKQRDAQLAKNPPPSPGFADSPLG